MTTHIMVDLETWGKTPGCDLRSIGAVVFDPIGGSLGRGFYCNVRNGEDYGLTRDPETVEWWSQQSEAAQQRLADDRCHIADALGFFGQWWEEQGDPAEVTFWAHGPHFDEAILAACYRAVGQPVPWHYRAPRDCRTIYEAAGGNIELLFEGVEHDARADAEHRAKCVIEAYRRIRAAGSSDRVTGLLHANNALVEKRRGLTALLREAGELFRSYEQQHRAKIEPDDGTHSRFMLNSSAAAKAERNAEIAGRIETYIAEIHQ